MRRIIYDRAGLAWRIESRVISAGAEELPRMLAVVKFDKFREWNVPLQVIKEVLNRSKVVIFCPDRETDHVALPNRELDSVYFVIKIVVVVESTEKFEDQVLPDFIAITVKRQLYVNAASVAIFYMLPNWWDLLFKDKDLRL